MSLPNNGGIFRAVSKLFFKKKRLVLAW